MKLSRQTHTLLYALLHILALAILFLLPLYLINFNFERNSLFLKGLLLQNGVYAALFYLNYSLLIPSLLFKRKTAGYLIAMSIAIVASAFLVEYGYHAIFAQLNTDINFRKALKIIQQSKVFMKGPPREFHFYTNLLTGFMVTGFSLGLRMAGRLVRNEREKKELEKEKLNSELAFLKNQVSPHFFFNTLNNIYSLIAINKDDAQNAVLSLSKLMRYLIYETQKGDTQISSEMGFMTNYINLMKLRLSDKVDLRVNFPKIKEDFAIAPLLFIPFIENAFKHGISYREKSFIHIQIEMIDQVLRFSCRNSFNPLQGTSKSDDSGIGLENVQKRLRLLFPGRHDLNIETTEQVFSVKLNIELKTRAHENTHNRNR